jgi:hypothetical protein
MKIARIELLTEELMDALSLTRERASKSKSMICTDPVYKLAACTAARRNRSRTPIPQWTNWLRGTGFPAGQKQAYSLSLEFLQFGGGVAVYR